MNYKKQVMIALTLFGAVRAQQLPETDEKVSLNPLTPNARTVRPANQSPISKSVADTPAAAEATAATTNAQPTNYGSGIDTLDVTTGGNWLQKRVIWEDAQRKYEKIQEMEHRTLEARMTFFEKRSSSDKTINLFYTDIGFAQGELDEILDTLLASIEKAKQQQGILTDKEREIQAKLYEKKNELEQLKADVKAMTDLDAALDNALMQLVNQITLAADYERQAWQRFKDIGQELDDRKAKEYYLEMDASAKNIEAIEGYIKGPLSQYFETVLSKINEYMNSVKTRLDALKQNGIELKNQLADLEQARQKEEPKQAPKPKGWFDTISVLWTYPISLIQRFWSFIASFIWRAPK